MVKKIIDVVPDCQLTHCTECVAPVMLPVPCQGCINIIYCSAKCRSEIHRVKDKYF